MKKQRIPMFLHLLMGLLIVVACEKLEDPALEEEQSLENLKDVDELKKAGIGNAIFVSPEGPDYDTENLLNAFREAAERPGATLVELTEGTFYLDQLLIQDFQGWFRGAGIHKTTIHPVPQGITLEATTPFYQTEPFFLNFSGGDIRISDMCIDINLDDPVEPYDWWTGGQVTFLTGVIRIHGSSPEDYKANSLIQRISLKGKQVDLFDFTPYNVDNAIIIGGGYYTKPLKGNHRIQECQIHGAETGINTLGAANAKVVFGGSPHQGNNIRDVNTGIFCIANEASHFRIACNQISEVHAYGIYLEQGEKWPPPFMDPSLDPGKSNFFIHDNRVKLAEDPWSSVITLVDYFPLIDPSKQASFKVLNNQGELAKASQIFLLSYASNKVKVIYNQVIGIGWTGFYVYGPSYGFKMVNNDFTSFTSEYADIYLAEDTYDNLVVAKHHTTVFDFGTNNKFEGNVELNTALKNTNTDLPKVRINKERMEKYHR